jgi:hypothetical protein
MSDPKPMEDINSSSKDGATARIIHPLFHVTNQVQAFNPGSGPCRWHQLLHSSKFIVPLFEKLYI